MESAGIRRRSWVKEKASALVLVLVVIIVAGLGTTAVLQAMISYSQMKASSSGSVTARYLADAGVQYGLTQLRLGINVPTVVGTPTTNTITSEKYTITITKSLNADGSYDVQASVQYPGV